MSHRRIRSNGRHSKASWSARCIGLTLHLPSRRSPVRVVLHGTGKSDWREAPENRAASWRSCSTV
jgi:hypothetical protein